MLKYILVAAVLFGSALAASSRPADDPLKGDSFSITAPETQVAQFNSRPARSDDGRLDSFGGY